MGMNFAFGTLATLLKYPWSSEYCIREKKKKLGYFFSEKELMENVINTTAMHDSSGNICRHPATFLLEAADDIAYLFADLEDGCKKNCFSFSDLNEIINEYDLAFKTKWRLKDWLNKIDKFTSTMRGKAREMANINAFRIYFQGRYIEIICDEFLKNYDEIMTGSYESELLECSTLAPITHAVKEICGKYIFNNREVLMLELAGKTVVNALLDKFSEAVADKNFENPKYGFGKLFALISENFKHAYKANNIGGENYKKLQLVVDFISGMTDSYALNLHRALTGVTLP